MKNQKKNRKERRKEILSDILYQQIPAVNKK